MRIFAWVPEEGRQMTFFGCFVATSSETSERRPALSAICTL